MKPSRAIQKPTVLVASTLGMNQTVGVTTSPPTQVDFSPTPRTLSQLPQLFHPTK